MRTALAFSILVAFSYGSAFAQQLASDGAYTPEGVLPPAEESDVPADVVDAVWAVIDKNKDDRTTDVEIYDAIRRIRVFANHKERTVQRDYVIEHFDADKDGLLGREEAVPLLARVRAERCEVAQRAITYWQSLDAGGNGQVEAEEIFSVLKGLAGVGKALAEPLDGALAKMDVDGNRAIDRDEASFSAHGLLRLQLATTGPGIKDRRPRDWMMVVAGVSSLDADADNLVSQRESTQIAGLPRYFAKIDKNRDGMLSAGELCDYREMIRAAFASVASAGGGICYG